MSELLDRAHDLASECEAEIAKLEERVRALQSEIKELRHVSRAFSEPESKPKPKPKNSSSRYVSAARVRDLAAVIARSFGPDTEFTVGDLTTLVSFSEPTVRHALDELHRRELVRLSRVEPQTRRRWWTILDLDADALNRLTQEVSLNGSH